MYFVLLYSPNNCSFSSPLTLSKYPPSISCHTYTHPLDCIYKEKHRGFVFVGLAHFVYYAAISFSHSCHEFDFLGNWIKLHCAYDTFLLSVHSLMDSWASSIAWLLQILPISRSGRDERSCCSNAQDANIFLCSMEAWSLHSPVLVSPLQTLRVQKPW